MLEILNFVLKLQDEINYFRKRKFNVFQIKWYYKMLKKSGYILNE